MQYISVALYGVEVPIVDRCLQQIGGLDWLIDLSLTCQGGDMRLLHAQLTALSAYQVNRDGSGSTLMELQHLVNLQRRNILTITGEDNLADGSSVPPNLQCLYMSIGLPTPGLIGLDNLHQVTA